jgi:hypothetical protein
MITSLANSRDTHFLSISYENGSASRLCIAALYDLRLILFFKENIALLSSAFEWLERTHLDPPPFLTQMSCSSDLIHDFFTQQYDDVGLKETLLNFLRKFNPNKIILSLSPFLSVAESDLVLLFGNSWLNDALIDSFFMKLCGERNEFMNMNTHFLQSFGEAVEGAIPESFEKKKLNKLVSAFYKKVLKHNSETETVFLPINISNVHWVLAIVELEERKIVLYDSLGDSTYRSEHGKIRKLLIAFFEEFDGSTDWFMQSVHEPVQTDGANCGVFISAFAEAYIRHTGDVLQCACAWTPQSLPFMRARMLQILTSFS